MRPTSAEATSWIEVLKSVILIAIGIFIIIHETLDVTPPSIVLLLTAGAALGLPVIDYATGIVKKRNGANGKEER